MLMKKCLLAGAMVFALTGGAAWAATPQQAMQTALQQYPGRVIGFERDRQQGQEVYEIKIRLNQGQVQEFKYLAANGQLLKTEREARSYPAIPASVMPLEKLMAQFAGGTVLEIELKQVRGVFRYDIEWRDAQGLKWEQVHDASSGALLTKKRDT